MRKAFYQTLKLKKKKKELLKQTNQEEIKSLTQISGGVVEHAGEGADTTDRVGMPMNMSVYAEVVEKTNGRGPEPWLSYARQNV